MAESDEAKTYAKAQALLDANRATEAVAVLTGYSGTPDSPASLALLGHAYLLIGDHEACTQALHSSIALDPHNTYSWLLLSRSQLVAEKLEDAYQSANQVIQLDPNSAEAHANMSMIQLHAENAPTAINHANLAVSMDPQSEAAWMALGRAQLQLQDFANVRMSATRALEINPLSTDGKVLLGLTQFAGEDREAAFESLVDAIRQDPTDEAVRDIIMLLARPERFHVPPLVRIIALVSGLALVLFAVWLIIIWVRWIQVPRDVRKLVWSNKNGRSRIITLYLTLGLLAAVTVGVSVAIYRELF